jgi:hypothetical protein
MIAFLTVKRDFCPVSRCYGYSVTHSGDACWGHTRAEAIQTLMGRLALKGYDRAYISEGGGR